MKSVLISIKPKWCELIANGKKTIEVRKTRPKYDMPFKCYVYCTKGFKPNTKYGYKLWAGCGKVIGEFVCDNIDTYDDDTIFTFRYEDYARWNDFDLNRACIHPEDFQNYSNGKWLYGWHISNLVIYDKPKGLSEFWNADKCPYVSENGCNYKFHCFRAGETKRCGQQIERPPQSWCYAEKI